jgi:hypothetical protein
LPLPRPTNLVSVKIGNPTSGVIRTIGREEPPQAPFLVNAQNVLPYDLLGRKRIGQRPGITPLYNINTLSSTSTIVQGLLQVGSIVQPGAAILPAPLYPWSTWSLMPFTITGNTISIGDAGYGSTSFVFASTQTLTISLSVSWTQSPLSTGVGPPPGGVNFGPAINPSFSVISGHNIWNIGPATYEAFPSGSTSCGGQCGVFGLLADSSTQYILTNSQGASGSYTFTGQYTPQPANMMLCKETITGTQTQSATSIVPVSFAAGTGASFAAWSTLQLWNPQVYTPNVFNLT